MPDLGCCSTLAKCEVASSVTRGWHQVCVSGPAIKLLTVFQRLIRHPSLQRSRYSFWKLAVEKGGAVCGCFSCRLIRTDHFFGKRTQEKTERRKVANLPSKQMDAVLSPNHWHWTGTVVDSSPKRGAPNYGPASPASTSAAGINASRP